MYGCIKDFIKNISQEKPYGLLFLKIYKNPNNLFDLNESEFIEKIFNDETYFQLWLNEDFIKLLKMCFDNIEFIKAITSEVCLNIVCFLDNMIEFKKGYSKSAEECESLEIEPNMRRQDIEAYAFQKLHFEKYRKIFELFSEEYIKNFDEQELVLLRNKISRKGEFIFKNYERPKTQKAEIYSFIENNGLNDFDINLEDDRFFVNYKQGQLSIPNELIYAFVCENKFLSVVCEFLKKDKIHNEEVLMSIYKILELSLICKEDKFEINDEYRLKCRTLISKETANAFDSSLARALMDSINKILLLKERDKYKHGLILIKCGKES